MFSNCGCLKLFFSVDTNRHIPNPYETHWHEEHIVDIDYVNLHSIFTHIVCMLSMRLKAFECSPLDYNHICTDYDRLLFFNLSIRSESNWNTNECENHSLHSIPELAIPKAKIKVFLFAWQKVLSHIRTNINIGTTTTTATSNHNNDNI